MKRLFVISLLLCSFLMIQSQNGIPPGYIEGGLSEKEATAYIDERIKYKSILPMEGIWQTTDGYKIAIVRIEYAMRVWGGPHSQRRGGVYGNPYLVVLHSQFERNGRIKGYLTESSVDNIYSLTYYRHINENGERRIIEDALFLKQDSPVSASFINKNGETVTMLKLYPKEDVLPPSPNFSETNGWTGTGFALNNKYVVTNYHVVENARNITLTGINGNFNNKYSATVMATDKKNDIALLKLNGNVTITNIPYSIKTSTSDVGEEVFVLGYPLTATMGDEIKLTTGVISSKSGFQGDISQYQISAPVQPGNSGGPLFDSKGNVIGIVSAKHVGAENVGYAIKTSYLKSLVESVTSASVLPQTNRVANQNLSGKVKAVKNYVYYIKCTQ